MNPNIISSIKQAISGEAYTTIRGITVGYSKESKILTLRYYFDRQPTENDIENVSVVATEILADLYDKTVLNIKEECIYSPNKKLKCLDEWVYLRKRDDNLGYVKKLPLTIIPTILFLLLCLLFIFFVPDNGDLISSTGDMIVGVILGASIIICLMFDLRRYKKNK